MSFQQITVRKESFPVRCDICHQSDQFDPKKGLCSRCSNLLLPIHIDIPKTEPKLKESFFDILTFGWVGGFICGFIIFSFGMLIGRNGTNGTEFIGNWSPRVILFSQILGSPIGSILLIIAYYINSYKPERINFLLPTAFGTILGGVIGSFIGPPLAAVTGCIGFFITWQFIVWFYRKQYVAQQS